MRSLPSLLTALALAAGLVALVSGQEPATTPAAPPARVRPPVVLSDLLTHSPLTPCATGAIVTAGARPAVRVASWNIRAGRSTPIAAIAEELAAMRADIIALQEVDVLVRRTGYVDQPVALAAALGFHHVFAASIKWDGGDYGLALLSRWPLAEVRRYRLDASQAGEPRIILEVLTCAGGRPLRVFNHHADGRAPSRLAGLAALREIVGPGVGRGMLALGDFNEDPDGQGVRGLIEAGLVDLGADGNESTADHRRIDYVLADSLLARVASAVRVWPSDKSDHHALVAELAW